MRKATTLPWHRESKPVRWSYSKAWTRFRMVRESMSRHLANQPIRLLAPVTAKMEGVVEGAAATREMDNEYIETVYPPARCDIAIDGGTAVGWRCRLSTVAGVRIASSRLSDDPGCDVLSRRKSRCHVLIGHGSTRTTIRTGSRIEADDVLEFVRLLGHHAPVLLGSQY